MTTAHAMKPNQTYSLVKGTYDSEEARGVLMSLVTDTIRFHNLKKLSYWERKGAKDEHSEKILKELNEMRENILKMISNVDQEQISVEIKAEIKVPANK